MATTGARKLETIRADARKLLRQYERAEEHARTPLLKQLAGLLVEGRSHFLTDDGTPDWRGKTYQYRVWAGEVYADIVTGDELKSLQAAVRYHVSAALRERLTEDELDELGLIKATARERSHDRRVQREAVLSAITSRDMAGGALLALTAANDLLRRVDVTELDDLSPEAVPVALGAVQSLESAARRWRRRLETRG
ncbi:hypothetical protein ACXJJ3_32715 [Kribbella sp. WER1]